MPMEVHNLDGGLGNLIRGWGVLESHEYLDALRPHVTRDEAEFKRFRYSVVDLTEVTDARLSAAAIKEAAELCRWAAKLNPDGVVALVTSSQVLFGLARMWETLAEGAWETRVFRARDEAESWIRERCAKRFGLGGITFTIADDEPS